LKTKIIIVIIVATILIIAAAIVLLHRPAIQGRQAITAIPVNSAIILKTNEIHQILSLISENTFFENLDKEKLGNCFTNFKTTIDSFLNENSFLRRTINDSALYFSLHYNNKAAIGIQVYFSINNKNSTQQLLAGLSDYFNKKGYKFININKKKTLDKIDKSKKQKITSIFYFYENGLLVLGNNSKNIAESFKQLNNGYSLANDTSFKQVFNSTGKNVTGSLFINLQQLPNLIAELLKPACMSSIRKVLNFKGWAALDFNIERNYMSLHGFSINIEKKQLWIKTLKNEQPVESYIYKALPTSTAFYGVNELKDSYNYRTEFYEKVHNDNKLYTNLKILRQSIGSKIDEDLLNIMDHSVALDICLRKENTFDFYCIMKTKNILESRNFLVSIQKNNIEKSKRNHKKPLSTGPGQETLFINLPVKNLPVVLFGQVFDCGKYPAVCNYKEFIVFGESIKSLHSFLEEINNKNISDDSIFRYASDELLISKANLTLFVNIQKMSDFMSNYMSLENSKIFKNIFKNTKSIFGLQVSGNGHFFYNNCFLYSEASTKNTTQLNGPSK
jgi:hypothetical protein